MIWLICCLPYEKTIFSIAVKPGTRLVFTMALIAPPGFLIPTTIIVITTAAMILVKAATWLAPSMTKRTLSHWYIQTSESHETLFIVRGSDKTKEITNPTTPKTREQVP